MMGRRAALLAAALLLRHLSLCHELLTATANQWHIWGVGFRNIWQSDLVMAGRPAIAARPTFYALVILALAGVLSPKDRYAEDCHSFCRRCEMEYF